MVLSFWACSFTAEKLRLDLFDRRFEIYRRTLEYCDVVMQYASLEMNERNRERIDAGITAAHESFRGIGYHKAKALFDRDITSLFEELNKSYAFISAYGPGLHEHPKEVRNAYFKHVENTIEITQKLPEHFKPYVYFGDIRRT